LHPPELAEIGLVGALREYLKNYQHRTQIGVDFQISGEERAMPVRVESELYRVAQEALTNCFKHARADHVDVQLAYGDAGLHLTIADNGQGFQVDLARLGGGMGIRGMMERIQSIGGQFKLDSRPDRGATVHVSMAYTDLMAVAAAVSPPAAETDNSDRKADTHE
jgi:two-component system, NarL family, sensor histidine kinase UhpB